MNRVEAKVAAASQYLNRRHFPARIRAKRASANDFSSRMALADRIADLPNVHTLEEGSDTLPCRVSVYLQIPCRSLRKEHQTVFLCSIGKEGIAINGLGEWDRHQVLCRGWGKLDHEHVLMFMPRDFDELEICWEFLQRAHSSLLHALAEAPMVHITPSRYLPRFSRTTLQ